MNLLVRMHYTYVSWTTLTISLFVYFMFIGNSAAMSEPEVEFCNAMTCFGTEEDKKAYEEEHNCIADKCDYAVTRVEQQTVNIDRDDRTYGFYRNQFCIADDACMDRASLDNSAWLSDVVFDFIEPLVNQEGRWQELLQECESLLPIFDSLVCQSRLADYHINTDLQNSLNTNGCGTQEDWDRIGDLLRQCINEGVEEDVVLGFESVTSAYAGYVVAGERNEVRDACIAHRRSNGLNIEF